jgi:hypothetical protein
MSRKSDEIMGTKNREVNRRMKILNGQLHNFISVIKMRKIRWADMYYAREINLPGP